MQLWLCLFWCFEEENQTYQGLLERDLEVGWGDGIRVINRFSFALYAGKPFGFAVAKRVGNLHRLVFVRCYYVFYDHKKS